MVNTSRSPATPFFTRNAMHKSYKATTKHHKLGVMTIAAALLMLGMFARADIGLGSGNTTYQIQPGDVLSISVWKEPDLQGEVLVRPDGGLSFPLAGDIAVEGK